MKILLDNSCSTIFKRQQEYPEIEFGQFRTPLTQYASGSYHYILDNGAYSEFKENTYKSMVQKAKHDLFCDYIVLPDVVGDATATFHQFRHWKNWLGLSSHMCAFVLQDGVHDDVFPAWDEFDCLFIGGSTEFKMSSLAYQIAQAAILEGKHVHVGRVNTPDRIVRWFDNCHTIDGSGISRFDHMLKEAVQAITECTNFRQTKLSQFV